MAWTIYRFRVRFAKECPIVGVATEKDGCTAVIDLPPVRAVNERTARLAILALYPLLTTPELCLESAVPWEPR